MRFDIEINITDTLSESGKEKLSNMLFAPSTTLVPAKFNDYTNFLGYSNVIDFSRFKLESDTSILDKVNPIKYISRVDSYGDFSLSKLLIKHGKLIPFLNKGTAYFYNYPVFFSYGAVKKNIQYLDHATENQPVCCGYTIQVPKDIDYNTIKIFTTNIYDNGIPYIENLYKFIDVNIVSVVNIEGELPTSYSKNTIIIHTLNGEVSGIYSTLINNTIRLEFRKDTIVLGNVKDSKTLLNNNGMALIDLESNTIITRHKDILFNFRHKSVFKTSSLKSLYLIDINPIDNNTYIYLNSARMFYEQEFSQYNIKKDIDRHIYFKSYPLSDISVYLYPGQLLTNNTIGVYNANEINIDTNNYEDFARLLLNPDGLSIKNNLDDDIYIVGKIHGTILPTISYARKNTYKDNSRHLLYDISASEINFTNGTICLSSNELLSNTIGETITFSYPDGKDIPFLSSIRVIVKLTNSLGMPVPNKMLKIKLNNTLNNSIDILSTSEINTTGEIIERTNILGEVNLNLVNTRENNCFFIQKEWAGDVRIESGNIVRYSSNKIILPYDLGATDVNNIFLFMITADDPLITQLDGRTINNININDFNVRSPYDYYGEHDKLESYYIEGRRIAYVSLQADKVLTGNTYSVKSKFIKPISVLSKQNIDDTEIVCKELFIYDSELDKEGKYSGNHYTLLNTHNDLASNFTIQNINMMSFLSNNITNLFDNNWLPYDNQFAYVKIIPNSITEIEFNNIPGINDDNVIGYMVRIIPDLGSTTITCEYTDGTFESSISNTSDQISIGTFIRNESELVLSTDIDQKNSYIGPYSYLTISEYINSELESNCTKYICKYSSSQDDNGNRCQNLLYKNFYIPNDIGNICCKHSVEYDLTINPIDRCPGLDQQLINPFLLYTE